MNDKCYGGVCSHGHDAGGGEHYRMCERHAIENDAVPCASIHCRHYDLAHGKMCRVEAHRVIAALAKAQS